MIALASDKVLCCFKFKQYEVYQAIELSRYDDIVKILPKGTKITMLVFNANSIYSFVKLLSVKNIERTTSYKVVGPIRGFTFIAPYGVKYTKAVTLPENFFKSKELSDKEILIGISTLNAIKSLDIKVQYYDRGKVHDITLEKFSKAEREIHNLRVKINDSSISINALNELHELSYIEDYMTYVSEAYWTHKLLNSGYLVPAFFANKYDFKHKHTICVPYDNHWLFQLKYGRYKDVYSHCTHKGWEHVNPNKMKFDVINTVLNNSLVELEFGANNCDPVLIQNNIAIRHVRKI